MGDPGQSSEEKVPGSGAEKPSAQLFRKKPTWGPGSSGRRTRQEGGFWMSVMPYQRRLRSRTPVPRAGPLCTIQAFHPGLFLQPSY